MKYVAPIASILAVALGAFSGDIAALVAAHPSLSIVFGGLAALVAAFAPQPQK